MPDWSSGCSKPQTVPNADTISSLLVLFSLLKTPGRLSTIELQVDHKLRNLGAIDNAPFSKAAKKSDNLKTLHFALELRIALTAMHNHLPCSGKVNHNSHDLGIPFMGI